MIQFKVNDMHCQACVARIRQALDKEGTAFTVDLDNKLVSVDAPTDSAPQFTELLEDLGFTPEIQ